MKSKNTSKWIIILLIINILNFGYSTFLLYKINYNMQLLSSMAVLSYYNKGFQGEPNGQEGDSNTNSNYVPDSQRLPLKL